MMLMIGKNQQNKGTGNIRTIMHSSTNHVNCHLKIMRISLTKAIAGSPSISLNPTVQLTMTTIWLITILTILLAIIGLMIVIIATVISQITNSQIITPTAITTTIPYMLYRRRSRSISSPKGASTPADRS